MVCALDNEHRGDDCPRWRPGTSRRPRSPSQRARATSTGRRSRACSRGCGRTTWSGTTWSTTTCSARSRRRSTSSTGTRTRSAWRPGCTATSSTSDSTTRSPRPARSRCSATPVDLGQVDLDTYFVAGLHRSHRAVGERVQRRAAVRRQRGGSCSRAAATSRRWSTRRAPDSRSSYRVGRRATRHRATSFSPRRRGCRAAGGRTGTVARRALGRVQAGARGAGKPRSQGAGEGARDATCTVRRARRRDPTVPRSRALGRPSHRGGDGRLEASRLSSSTRDVRGAGVPSRRWPTGAPDARIRRR